MVTTSSSVPKVWREPTKAEQPPKDADLDVAWPFLEKGVDHIMTRLSTGMSYTYYIQLYTAIYNFCTMSRASPSASFGQRGASLQGSELYKKLHGYFSSHCQQLKQRGEPLSDVELLKYYAAHWDEYTRGATYVHKLFNYLNKHWVKREKDEGRKEVYTIYTLALVCWKVNFFNYLQREDANGASSSTSGTSRLTQALLRQIEQQRNGEQIDAGLMKRVIDSYVALGLDEADTQRQVLDVYKDAFQAPFLKSTIAYYSAESHDFVQKNSISDYMKKAEARLLEETDRIDLYLHDTTRSELKSTCEACLIAQHHQLLWEEFQSLLDLDRTEDLARMYGLLSRTSGGLEPLRKKFEGHVRKAGQSAVERILPVSGPSNEPGRADPERQDPKAYVEALLGVYNKFSDVVNQPFRAELGFNASLDKACREFCNHNAACPTSTKSPELLAGYCDQLLKKSSRDVDGEALEAALNQAMAIFKFIDDKDVFQKFYQKKLAQRLVAGTSTSDDAESSMITKLKEVSGYDYTNKLTRMFTDVNISRDLTERFKDRERTAPQNSDIDLSVLVLGSNFWPLNAPTTGFTVPSEIQTLYDRFIKFHADVHSGRKLSWLWHVSKNELRVNYLNQKYIFMTSSYQMAILCAFNHQDRMSFNEVQAATGMSDNALKPQLSLLVKAKVLLDEDGSYALNYNFKSKKIRVSLNQPVRSEQRAETTEVLQAVDEDRKFVYQAQIVRIMKARKSMKHQALIQEVTAQISQKFTPKVPEIKKAIDYLLDKEYLERAEESKDTYNYLA